MKGFFSNFDGSTDRKKKLLVPSCLLLHFTLSFNMRSSDSRMKGRLEGVIKIKWHDKVQHLSSTCNYSIDVKKLERFCFVQQIFEGQV